MLFGKVSAIFNAKRKNILFASLYWSTSSLSPNTTFMFEQTIAPIIMHEIDIIKNSVINIPFSDAIFSSSLLLLNLE